MTDRAEEVAEGLIDDYERQPPGVRFLKHAIAAALRAYAEEARREEHDVAAKDAAMRYEDGYACGMADDQEALKLWTKDRCGHCQITAEDFAADQAATIHARGEG